MNRRKLTFDEHQLWENFSQNIEPLNFGDKDVFIITKSQKDLGKKKENGVLTKSVPFSRLEKDKNKNKDYNKSFISSPGQMDQKSYKKMRKGKLIPEAKLDLHGLTKAQAQPSLVDFVLSSFNKGKRLVLVITGKGNRGDETSFSLSERGVLRQLVPIWLRSEQLSRVILKFESAHSRHGGSGATYVYLRKNRENTKQLP
tara:strand:- start:710 stop:1309 length:600 start_codon:yes stop_codon:yes gene_type:complete